MNKTHVMIDALNQRTMSSVVSEYSAIAGESLGMAERSALSSILPKVKNKRILDIGVGAGRTVAALREISADYVGVDYVQEMVDHCRSRFPGVRFEKADARSLPQFADASFDLIVFDWDGTLFDSTALITRCIQAACADVGVAVPSAHDASWVIGMGLIEALQHAAPGLPRERYPELGNRYRHHYFAAQHEVVLFDGTLHMLQALKARHHWLGVATGKSRRGLDEALNSVQLAGMFDATRTADETAPKPNPLMLVELMRELGVEPDRTLMVGDTTHDLQLAANAGVASVGVGYGAHDVAAFEAFRPLHVAASVLDLHDWLARHA